MVLSQNDKSRFIFDLPFVSTLVYSPSPRLLILAWVCEVAKFDLANFLDT